MVCLWTYNGIISWNFCIWSDGQISIKNHGIQQKVQLVRDSHIRHEAQIWLVRQISCLFMYQPGSTWQYLRCNCHKAVSSTVCLLLIIWPYIYLYVPSSSRRSVIITTSCAVSPPTEGSKSVSPVRATSHMDCGSSLDHVQHQQVQPQPTLSISTTMRPEFF